VVRVILLGVAEPVRKSYGRMSHPPLRRSPAARCVRRAVHECVFAYRWALANCDKLGWTGQRVVLAGDSAGGNLAVAVALRCVKEKLRVPDAIVPFYPALNLQLSMSPSRLLTIFDALLPMVRCTAGRRVRALAPFAPSYTYRHATNNATSRACPRRQGVLRNCVQAYTGVVPEEFDNDDPFLTPFSASDELLRGYVCTPHYTIANAQIRSVNDC